MPITAVGGWGEGAETTYYDEYGRQVVDVNAFSDVAGPSWQVAGQQTQPTEGAGGVSAVAPPAPPVSLASLLPAEFYGRDQYAGQMVPAGTDPYVALGLMAPGGENPGFMSTNPRDYIGPGRYATESIWGHDPAVREAALKIGGELGLGFDQIIGAATSAADAAKAAHGGAGYTEASSPLEIVQNIANNLFTATGSAPEQLFTPEQITQSQQAAQAYQDQLKSQDHAGILGTILDIANKTGKGLAVLFGGPALGGAISSALGTVGAVDAGIAAGAGGQAAANEIAGLSFAEAGAGGAASTVDALATAAGIASQVAGGATVLSGVEQLINDTLQKVVGQEVGNQLGEVVSSILNPQAEVTTAAAPGGGTTQSVPTSTPPVTTPGGGAATVAARLRSGRRLTGTRGQIVDPNAFRRLGGGGGGRGESILTALGGAAETLG